MLLITVYENEDHGSNVPTQRKFGDDLSSDYCLYKSMEWYPFPLLTAQHLSKTQPSSSAMVSKLHYTLCGENATPKAYQASTSTTEVDYTCRQERP